MKKFFGVAIGSIFVYFVLTICRMNLATLSKLFTNNMMQLFLMATFAYVLFLVSYINIKVELKGSYYRENEYFPKRYLMQLVFWLGIVVNYKTGPLHQVYFQGNLLSNLFDIAFYYSLICLIIFGFYLFVKIIKMQIEKKFKKQKSSRKPYFYSDNPVINNRDDKLHREKFVNHVISNLNKINGENLTIGFYGKWGTGKTSIFKMIKEKIEHANNKDEYLIFEFKPWYFGKDDYEIIVEFLEQLLNEIRKSNGFDSEIEKSIIKYSNALSSVSLRLPGITINFKETHSLIEGIFGGKSQSIKDIKEAIEKSLKKSNKKIIVFIDDIDRLNKEEIQTIFRLVRLICDFPNITYIVALDEEIVASALAELHGKDENVDAKKLGRDYLEKFIQIPLYIPETDVYSMNKMLWDGVREILEENNLLEESEFLNLEFSSTERLIDLQELEFTPRNINRYLNTVKFMVPLLKSETNIDDLLYLLLIKIGSPGLYETIKVSSKVLLRIDLKDNKLKTEIEEKYPDYKLIIRRIFPDFWTEPEDEKNYVIDRENRICSQNHFKRYFMYDVLESEKKLSVFVKNLEMRDINSLSIEFERLLSLYSAEKVFSIIECNIEKMDIAEYKNVIKVMQIALSKERENNLTYYTNEYIRIISIQSVYLGTHKDNPIISNSIDIWLINRVYKVLDGYLEGKQISTIHLIEKTNVSSFISVLENRIKEYCSSKTLEDIFKKYNIEEGAQFILLWDNIEEMGRKREVIRKWIKNEDNFKLVLELIMRSQTQGEKFNRALKQYKKVVKLIDIEVIIYYLNDFKKAGKEAPLYYNKLLNLHEMVIKELNDKISDEEQRALENKCELNYGRGIEGDIEILKEYGDNKIKKKIQEHETREAEFNKNIYPEIARQEMIEEGIKEEFDF
ncbi:hypothetical protein CN557_03060 [Bacillus wiedmannii]|uniref:KAP family P-loop NTPase fold protein n=2 Tax=Bacillus wiedmannii TaxID=1890302 RepID=UPI000BF6C24E|nr:P-loop NTPase fold protein [Bacillus wiedmannii]PEP54714.1 hypothetical protein CN557_03060 [Bacillus wiedmannii]